MCLHATHVMTSSRWSFDIDYLQQTQNTSLCKIVVSEVTISIARCKAAQAAAQPDTPAAAPLSAEAMQKAIKSLIRSIPSDRDGVFAYPIAWAAYDTGRASMAGKILAWVKKKVRQYCQHPICMIYNALARSHMSYMCGLFGVSLSNGCSLCQTAV